MSGNFAGNPKLIITIETVNSNDLRSLTRSMAVSESQMRRWRVVVSKHPIRIIIRRRGWRWYLRQPTAIYTYIYTHYTNRVSRTIRDERNTAEILIALNIMPNTPRDANEPHCPRLQWSILFARRLFAFIAAINNIIVVRCTPSVEKNVHLECEKSIISKYRRCHCAQRNYGGFWIALIRNASYGLMYRFGNNLNLSVFVQSAAKHRVQICFFSHDPCRVENIAYPAVII